MKTVILAGGFGTRLAEYTDVVPKPMVHIGGKPILWHIMNSYAKYGYKDFYLALGYKAEIIRDYFLNYRVLNSDFTIDLASGVVQPHRQAGEDWRVTLVDTGNNSMTGGRLLRLQEFLKNERFLLTYGDGVSDVDLKALITQHEKENREVTLTAVRPRARFGELVVNGKAVCKFSEKPQIDQGWINGGFFVMEPSIFERIDGDDTVLEQEPLEGLARDGKLGAYRHEGYWQCMDTKRDRDALNNLWNQGIAPWA